MRRAADTLEEYIFLVSSPSWSYTFGLEFDKRVDQAYRERQLLEFQTVCIYPERFRDREGSGRLWGNRDLLPGGDLRKAAKSEVRDSIGVLKASPNVLELDIDLAPDVLWQIGQGMANGTITSMNLNGSQPQRRVSRLRSVSFHGPAFDPFAYVGYEEAVPSKTH